MARDGSDLVAGVVGAYIAGLMSLGEAAGAIRGLLSSVGLRVVEVPSVNEYCSAFGLECLRVHFTGAIVAGLHMVIEAVEDFVGEGVGGREEDMIFDLVHESIKDEGSLARLDCLLSGGCEAVLFLLGPVFEPHNAYVMGSTEFVGRVAREIEAFRDWAYREKYKCYKRPTELCIQDWRSAYNSVRRKHK